MEPIAARPTVAVKTQLMKVGSEIFPVYGDERSGFTVDSAEVHAQTPRGCRYGSLEELFFALVNLNICPEGNA